MIEEKTSHAEFTIYGEGLCYASACTSLSDDEATLRINRERPAGTTRGWVIAEEQAFADGTLHPCPCPDAPDTHRHLLFAC